MVALDSTCSYGVDGRWWHYIVHVAMEWMADGGIR